MTEGLIAGNVFENDVGYSTCDLYLAAFFVSAGCNMVDSNREKKSRRVYFIFEKSPILNELKINYFSRKAKIDALTFGDNIKSLKSLCHNLVNISQVSA